jgi:hypothetical protein
MYNIRAFIAERVVDLAYGIKPKDYEFSDVRHAAYATASAVAEKLKEAGVEDLDELIRMYKKYKFYENSLWSNRFKL